MQVNRCNAAHIGNGISFLRRSPNRQFANHAIAQQQAALREPIVFGRCAMMMRVTPSVSIARFTLASMTVSRCEVQQSGATIQRPREQDTLALTTGERRSHITDQRVVGHRHALDLVVHASELRTVQHMFVVKSLIEEADIVRNRSGKKLIVLHHHASMFAERAIRCSSVANCS
jgi:hypothetical protein